MLYHEFARHKVFFHIILQGTEGYSDKLGDLILNIPKRILKENLKHLSNFDDRYLTGIESLTV